MIILVKKVIRQYSIERNCITCETIDSYYMKAIVVSQLTLFS